MANLLAQSTVIFEQEDYRILELEVQASLLLEWKQVSKLELKIFKEGIIKFANLCNEKQIKRAVINAMHLDPKGDPFGWVSGQKEIEGEEAYTPWWFKKIVPIYHEAGTSSLTVATGNPEAPGKLPDEVFPDVQFAIVYLTGLEEAIQWKN